MISEKDIMSLGFVRNLNYIHPGFDEWIYKEEPRFGIGDFNGHGFLIEGIEWMEPISSIHDLKMIVDLLTTG